jgi:hypothetical protein
MKGEPGLGKFAAALLNIDLMGVSMSEGREVPLRTGEAVVSKLTIAGSTNAGEAED